ncbi:hypothetical protein BDA96_02G099900 [Sorghum bicolor]|uniref:Uncharacterized protein n=1 Tax=Sorghum bicolor TaxID=4558 RepID=A0A921RL96_SORBI|nr:hypothetical protein BDA96_02G099900 [Sorghum bicolor]
MQVKQSVFGLYKGTVERVTAPRTASAFLEKGVLSVPEFVLAGDNLVAKFFFRKGGAPASQKGSKPLQDQTHRRQVPHLVLVRGDPSKRKPYLPADKQFLVTRNVPCLRRAISVEGQYDAAGAEVVVEDDQDGEGWLATHGVQASKPEEEEDIPDMDTFGMGRSDGIKSSIPSYFSGGKEEEEEEDIPDMDNYKDTRQTIWLLLSDHALLQKNRKMTTSFVPEHMMLA